MLNLIHVGRLERIRKAVSIGAAEEIVKLYTCEISEIMVVTNLCIHNIHAAQTLDVEIGTLRGGVLFKHKVSDALAADAGLSIDNPFYVRQGEGAALNLLGSGAATTGVIYMEGFVIDTGPSSMYHKIIEAKEKVKEK